MSSAASSGAKDFFELVKAIGESKSKQEEDRIIADEVLYLKKAIPQTGLTKKKMKELVVRSLYVEMLGQDASFAYIKAVELCASTSIMQKRAGYLAASLCLSPDHEFRFMLVNQIQRDMKSSNFLEVCAALSAVCKIVTEDMIPAVIGDVVKLFKHEMDAVRKRSLCAMHRLYQMDKKCVADHLVKIRGALCDKDPSVMGATLPLLQAMISDSPAAFKDLVPSFVSILKQITDHRLPRDFDYHRIPSPWIQINLLRILAILGRGDQASSEGMYEVLSDAMKRADTGINVGYAIVYEVVKTVTTIYPNTVLLDASATSISRFIRSDSHNLKYIGIKGLTSIVKDHPRYAADHQMAVIDCLEDPDETLKRKTLDLLFQMTNAVNVEFIVDKLLSFLANATDDHFRTDLVGQITQCAERFAPSNAWYVQTVIKVFELAGDKVKPTVAHTLTQLIAEGSDSETAEDSVLTDDELRTEAVENFLLLIGRPTLPETLAQAIAWILGEYGYLSTSSSKEDIMIKLVNLFTHSTHDSTKSQVITALMKLVAQNGSCPTRVVALMSTFRRSQSLEVQQRCVEFQALLQHPDVMVDVLPVDASCEDLDIDESLSCLDGFVQTAMLAGAKPYSPPSNLFDDDGSAKRSLLKVTPYEMPALPVAVSNAMSILPASAASNIISPPAPPGPTALGPAISNQQINSSSATAQGNQLIGTRGAQQVWGKKVEPPPPPPAAPVVPNSVASANTTSPSSQTISAAASDSPSTLNSGPSTHLVGAPIENKPKVLTEKEKMAAALFGGVGGGSGKASSAAAGANKKKVPQGVLATGPTTGVAWGGAASSLSPTAAGSSSLLATTPAVATINTSAPIAPTSVAAPVSIFSDLERNLAPATNTVPAVAAPVAASSANLLDMLDTSDFTPVAPSPRAAPPPVPVFAAPPSPQPSVPVQSMSGNGVQKSMAGGVPSQSISDAFSDMLLTASSPNSSSFPSTDDSDFIRPLQINTAEFGRRWGSNPAEAKRSVSSALGNLDHLRSAMPPRYQHIESIANTQEAIFAATHTSLGSTVLVHVKLAAARRSVDVTVKSTVADLCNREATAISNALSLKSFN